MQLFLCPPLLPRFRQRPSTFVRNKRFLRELSASNKTFVSHVNATDPPGDIFTKFMDHPRIKAMLDNKIITFASQTVLLHKITIAICIVTCIKGRAFAICVAFFHALCVQRIVLRFRLSC